MNPEDRIAELQAQIESAKAQIAQLKAGMQEAKAEEMKQRVDNEDGNLQDRNTADAIAAFEADRGLTGDRDEDGTLKPANDLAAWYDVMVKQAGADWMDNPVYKASADWYKSQLQTTNTDDLVESDAMISGAGEVIGAIDEDKDRTKETMKGLPPVEIDTSDYDKDRRADSYSEKQKFMGIDREQGKAMAMQDDVPERSMGFKADEGGNMSVDEKDDFWKTQEGYNKAMEMYGQKPSFVPAEPTMVFNPTTQEYEEIKDEDKEEFVDFAQPRMSADLKALLG